VEKIDSIQPHCVKKLDLTPARWTHGLAHM